MERELTWLDALFVAALLDQWLGQFGAFAMNDHSAGIAGMREFRTFDRVESRFRVSLAIACFSHAPIRYEFSCSRFFRPIT
jgi:hypothetical protein